MILGFENRGFLYSDAGLYIAPGGTDMVVEELYIADAGLFIVVAGFCIAGVHLFIADAGLHISLRVFSIVVAGLDIVVA